MSAGRFFPLSFFNICEEPEHKRFLIWGHSLCVYKCYPIQCLNSKQTASDSQFDRSCLCNGHLASTRFVFLTTAMIISSRANAVIRVITSTAPLQFGECNSNGGQRLWAKDAQAPQELCYAEECKVLWCEHVLSACRSGVSISSWWSLQPLVCLSYLMLFTWLRVTSVLGLTHNNLRTLNKSVYLSVLPASTNPWENRNFIWDHDIKMMPGAVSIGEFTF
jgi:hypothetical protein